MSFIENLGRFPHTIGNLDDRPNLTAAQMKAKLEADCNEVWDKVSECVPEVNKVQNKFDKENVNKYVTSESTHTTVPTSKAVYDAIAAAAMGDSTTIINNWLDNHPEATTTVVDGSITIAKLSTDVKDSLDLMPIAVAGATGVTPLWFKSGYYNTPAVGSSVSYHAYSDFVCAYAPISEGERIVINASGTTGNTRLYVFVDENWEALNRCDTSLSGVRSVVAPAGAAFVAVNNKLANLQSGYYAYIGNHVIDSDSVSYKYCDYSQGAIGADGYEGASFVYCRTGFIPVEDVTKIDKPSNMRVFVNEYAYDKSFIKRTNLDSGTAAYYTKDEIDDAFKTYSTVYLRFSVARFAGDDEMQSTPEDIINSALNIHVAGCSNTVYDRLRKCEELDADTVKGSLLCKYISYEQGNITNSGEEAASSNYCRTGFFDINTVDRLYKPADDFNVLVCTYDSSKTFISRSAVASIDTEVDYDHNAILYAFGGGSVKYLRFTVAKAENGDTVDTTVEDIVNSSFRIGVYGSLNDVYDKVAYLTNEEEIPSYYFTTSYLPDKINAINGREDSASVNHDSFIFLTDYHFQKNAQYSPAIIKRIVKQTGICKLFFGGDAGRSASLANMYRAARENGEVYQKLWEAVPHFYGVVGNHEWNDTQDQTHETSRQDEVYTRAGVVNFYIDRQEPIVSEMSAEGNYWVDNKKARIRYFFLQDTGQAKLSNDTVEWLGDQLQVLPANYYVVVVSHYAYTGGVTGSDTMTGRGNLSVIRISQLLGALKSRTSVTVNKYSDAGATIGTMTFDYSNASATPVCIVSGHTHWDASLTTDQSGYGILTIATTTDAYGYAQNADTHQSEPREPGTVEEQAFDVYQIDLDSRTVYLTRIGGGNNRSFTF